MPQDPPPRPNLSEPLPAPSAPPAPAALRSALSASAPSAAPSPEFAPALPAAVPAGDTIPSELRQQLAELEDWAIANRRDARNDTIAFWSLKIPAVLTSAGAGILAHFDLTTVSLVMGGIASACVIVDGVNPRGVLRNVPCPGFP